MIVQNPSHHAANSIKMKKFIQLLSVNIVAMFYLASCCTPNAMIGSQPVALRAQETGMWCWAASAQMCMQFLGANVDQCTQANNEFGRNDCCNSPVPNDCVNGGWPEFDKYSFTSNRTSNTALSWDALKKQIYCKKKPVAFSWHWTGGGGHVMVVTGYAVINNEKYLFINDPWSPNQGAQYSITYDNYVTGGDHTHWDDFYDITKK